jgi:hypothetical protein
MGDALDPTAESYYDPNLHAQSLAADTVRLSITAYNCDLEASDA